jgi:hypothetical protein
VLGASMAPAAGAGLLTVPVGCAGPAAEVPTVPSRHAKQRQPPLNHLLMRVLPIVLLYDRNFSPIELHF